MLKLRYTLLLMASLAPLCAQNPTATLVGTVRDATGAVIAGAPVELRNVDTNDLRAFTSGASGEYTIPNLPPGK